MLSTAYIFGQATRKVETERQKLMDDNDWTAAQVAQYPGRLVGFCGLSPNLTQARPSASGAFDIWCGRLDAPWRTQAEGSAICFGIWSNAA